MKEASGECGSSSASRNSPEALLLQSVVFELKDLRIACFQMLLKGFEVTP